MPVVYLSRNPSTPTQQNVLLTGADPAPMGAVEMEPGLHYAVRVRQVGEHLCIFPVGALDADLPHEFYGFLVRLTPNAPVVATGRGSIVVPAVEGGGPLVPGREVYLAATPGHVTHAMTDAPGHSQVRVGTALDASTMALITDFRLQF